MALRPGTNFEIWKSWRSFQLKCIFHPQEAVSMGLCVSQRCGVEPMGEGLRVGDHSASCFSGFHTQGCFL